MSSQQLKDLFEAGLAAPAPDRVDVDAAIAAGRRRRRIRVGSTVLASCAAVVVAVLLVTGVLPPRGADMAGPADGTRIPLPISQWKDGDAGMAALLEGVLLLRADRCLVVVSPKGESVIAWPAGFTAVARDGGADVVGTDGTVVAQTGEQIALGGGEGTVGVTGPCLGGAAPIFAVNEAPPYDRTRATATPAMWTPVESGADLQGTWLAVSLGGADASGAIDLDGGVLVAAFLDGGRLEAVDGLCNDIESSYDAGPGGDLRIASPSLTAVGCGQGQGWPAAAQAIYGARSAQVLAPDGDRARRLRLIGEDGAVLGEYVQVPGSTTRDTTAGYLCRQALATGPGLVDVTHAQPTTVGAVRERTGGPSDTSPAAERWAALDGAAPAAWCTSRVGSTWSVTAVTADGPPVEFMSAGTPLGDPGADGPPIP
jgi:hypothetical protein